MIAIHWVVLGSVDIC